MYRSILKTVFRVKHWCRSSRHLLELILFFALLFIAYNLTLLLLILQEESSRDFTPVLIKNALKIQEKLYTAYSKKGFFKYYTDAKIAVSLPRMGRERFQIFQLLSNSANISDGKKLNQLIVVEMKGLTLHNTTGIILQKQIINNRYENDIFPSGSDKPVNNRKTDLLLEYYLQYPQFTTPPPKFIDKTDHDIFFALNQSVQTLEFEPRPPEKLRGHVAIIQNTKIDPERDCGWKNDISDYTLPVDSTNNQFRNRRRQKPTVEFIVPLLVPDAFAFQHFIDGVMPKIAQIYPLLKNDNVKLVIHAPKDKIIYEMLDALGITKNKILFYYSTNFQNSAEYQINTCITPPTHPILWDKMRQILGVQKHLQIPMEEASVMLLTRAKSRNGGRQILNFDQVANFLLSRYKSKLLVFDGGLNFTASLNTFGKVRLIIGNHGGAFFNLNFCPVDTVIVEYLSGDLERPLFNPSIGHTMVWKMAALIGQSHYRVYENIVGNMGDINIRLQKLKLILDKIDKKQGLIP